MKNSADVGGCYPPRPSASVGNTLLYLQNSSYPTQPHSIIASYSNEGAIYAYVTEKRWSLQNVLLRGVAWGNYDEKNHLSYF